jgi:hypothetical protein
MASLPKKKKNGQPKGIFREIFVSAKQELAHFGMVFVYPPENFEQKQLGTVFGIIKISDTSQKSSFVANLLSSVIKKEYFGKPARSAYDSFEASLKKANFALAELARQGSVNWIGKISFVGGALEKNNLHFSKLGSTAILLLRGGMLADIGSDLDRDTAEVDAHPVKTFSDISSGRVEQGDRVIFTTSDLLEIFSFEEIRQNASRFSRAEFPEILSASLTANSELSGTIVLSMVPEEESAEGDANRLMKNMPKRQETPERIKILPSKKFPIANPPPPYIAPAPIAPIVENKNNLRISESEDILPKKSTAEKTLLVIKNIFSGAKSSTLFVSRKTYRLFGRIDWKKIPASARSVYSSTAQILRKINLPETNRRNIAVASVIGAFAIASFSIFKFIGNKNMPAAPRAPVSTVDQAAPPFAPADINAKNVENISEVATLPAGSNELIFMKDSLFSLSGDKSILKIDPASGATENMSSTVESGKFTLAAAMPDLNTIFVLTSDKKIISFTPSNKKFSENNISLPGNLNASDMKSYLTYLYVIDSIANQIYRYPRAEGGFGETQNWLKGGQDLKGANKFAINEDIFTANDLNVIPFLQGKTDSAIDFQKPQIPLRIDAIYTDRDFANIYVLDNTNHRILAYSKDGKIAAQYFSPTISGIKNIVADERNKFIYLQKSDSVSKFSME